MLSKWRNATVVVSLILAVTCGSGCWALFVGAAAGVGGYAWANGAMTKDYSASADDVHEAVVKGLKKLKMPVLTDVNDRLSAKVTSEFSDGKNVVIDIDALTEQTARLRIRVGPIGDKTASELILSSVEKYL